MDSPAAWMYVENATFIILSTKDGGGLEGYACQCYEARPLMMIVM